ncbi:DoxX family protein [Streptomyces sp. OR43]|uniref:DoxX family protein n=1 Tax=Streptomyces sp. or43 TaxID=2478957 RepID=UPI0011CE830A|nr:DoxX family protein [Streptomyces sp. or43]TXS38892.1 hypothetical protein EAO72_37890 [Streptomyces sp. or43]
MIQPWWPLAGLAVVQLADAVLCVKPADFIRDCLQDVGFPRRLWPLLPLIKASAAAGLVAGIWFTPLAVLTGAALVCYFLVAITLHVRARDLSRNLFLNATGMLLLSAATFAFTLQAA